MQQIKIFWWGLMISFLGTLPLGTLNVSITNVSVQDGIMAAWWFALGATIVEVVYVRLALVAMDKVMKRQKVFKAFEWLTVLLLFALSIFSLIAAVQMKGLGAAVPSYAMSPFALGAFLSLIHPLHIPFWFGWSTILINRKILIPSCNNYHAYVGGMAIGSMIGLGLFIYGSQIAISQIKTNQHVINYIIGFILLLTALIQTYRLLPQRVMTRIKA
ncbi:LysE family transporter [Aridibaculum aurantiacum]|uniref:LysE family transporter n=1 Tax=Aridibaculum aurantiacum TaxID=2810307 RepID=UPI001A96EA3E|nr:LysE family transporter [Aridibaculum aurantiacum]